MAALAHISADSLENQQQIVNNGGMNLILEAINKHDTSEVMTQAFGMLFTVIANNKVIFTSHFIRIAKIK